MYDPCIHLCLKSSWIYSVASNLKRLVFLFFPCRSPGFYGKRSICVLYWLRFPWKPGDLHSLQAADVSAFLLMCYILSLRMFSANHVRLTMSISYAFRPSVIYLCPLLSFPRFGHIIWIRFYRFFLTLVAICARGKSRNSVFLLCNNRNRVILLSKEDVDDARFYLIV